MLFFLVMHKQNYFLLFSTNCFILIFEMESMFLKSDFIIFTHQPQTHEIIMHIKK